jgi:hypothetical protein
MLAARVSVSSSSISCRQMFRDLLGRDVDNDLKALWGRNASQRVESPDQASQDDQPPTDQEEQFEFRDCGRTQGDDGRATPGGKQADEGGTRQGSHESR